MSGYVLEVSVDFVRVIGLLLAVIVAFLLG
jgi:hypothetical protein